MSNQWCGSDAVQIFLGDLRALDEFFRSASCDLALEQTLDTFKCIAFHDPHLVSQILLDSASVRHR